MSVSARVQDIEARIAEHHEITGLSFVAVVCDGCGRTVVAYESDLDKVERVFSGWVIGTRRPYKDFCPRCA